MAGTWADAFDAKYGLNKKKEEGIPQDLPWEDQFDLKHGLVTVEELNAKYKKQAESPYTYNDPTRVGPKEQVGMGTIVAQTARDIAGRTAAGLGVYSVAKQASDPLMRAFAPEQVAQLEDLAKQQLAVGQEERDANALELQESLATRGAAGQWVGNNLVGNLDSALPLLGGAVVGLATRSGAAGLAAGRALAMVPTTRVLGTELHDRINSGIPAGDALRQAGTQAAIEMVTEALIPGLGKETSALKLAAKRLFGESGTELLSYQGGTAADMAEGLAAHGNDARVSQLGERIPSTVGQYVEDSVNTAAVGTIFGGVAAASARADARNNKALQEVEELKKLVLPKVQPTGDKAFDAGQAAGVDFAASAAPVDLFGDPVEMPKQVQPELTEFDLEQRKAEAFRMSPAGREAKAREEFAAQEAAKRKTLEDNALRTGIRNRLTGQGIDGNVPDQGGLFGQDTPANEAERARSASAEASRRTPRVLENDPEGPSEAVYSGGEVGPQTSDREAMDRATDFDTDRSLQENDAEAVVKNRKQFFGPLAEEAALVQARLEAKNASPEALKPFKVDGDTAQDLGDARERYAQAILPQTRKEEQERREKIYDRALDVVVTGRNRFATGNRGSQESVPAQEQGELDFSGSPAQTGRDKAAEQPSLFSAEQAPVPATQPKPTEFKSRLTAERERLAPTVEKGLKNAEKAEKAERTKAVNEEKAKEEALVAASIADVKKAQPDLKGDDLKNAVFARVEERRRTGNLPKTEKKTAPKKGPKSRLSKKEAKQDKADEKANEARERVKKALAQEDNDDSKIDNSIVRLSKQIKETTPERRKQLVELYVGNDTGPQTAATIAERVLKDPNLTDELREVAKRLLNHKSLQKTLVHFVSKKGPFADQLKKSFGRHVADKDSTDVLIRDGSWDNHGLHPIVILHELVHATTSRIIHDIQNGGGTVVARKAYKDLQKLLITIRKNKQSLNDSLGTEAMADKMLESPEELLAYANTDPDFRAWLRQENFWDPIINFLAKMLNWPTNKVNLLDKILSLGETIESEQDSAARSAAMDKGRKSRESGDAISNEMAEPVFKELDVVRHFDKNEAQLSPKLAGFKRQVAQWLQSTGKDTAAAREAKDASVEERAGQFVQLSQSRNRMNSLLAASDLKPDDLNDIEKLKASHPAIYNEYRKVRQITRALGKRLAADFVKHNEKNMTDKDWAVMEKVLNNEDYFRRTYKKNAPRGLGKKYAENLLKMASEHDPNAAVPTDPKKKALYDQYKDAYDTVQAAKQLLVDDYLTFPETWDDTKIKHLRRLYSIWTGREPVKLKRDQIIETLEKYRDTSNEKINSMADNFILDLLDLRDPNNKISTFFKPGQFNKSILIPRENIPQAIRDLWGENKDPLTKLYSTWGALAVATSHIQYLNSEVERGKAQGFLFDAEETPDFDRDRHSVQISAAGMGPLANLYTTPRFKETMEIYVQAQEATVSALLAIRPSDAFTEKLPWVGKKVLKPLARLTKYVATVGSVPGNYLLNAFGAPLNMIMNGNFNVLNPTFYKSVTKSLKGMRDAVAAYERKEINQETLELLVNGILDSSFVGELQASERAEMEKELTSKGFAYRDEQKAKWSDRGRAVVATATDVYAIMDLYAKAANYYAEKSFLEKFYKRRGIEKTEKQLQKDAAERTKRTNLTYTRAAAISKSLEGMGLSMFLTYFGETYRAATNNLVVGYRDIKLGTKLKDAGLIAHGTARVAGASAAVLGTKTLMAMYAVPYKLIFGAAGVLFGSDDDEERVIQEGMGDFYEGRLLSLLESGLNGVKSFVDIGRLDPNDPVSTPLRHIADGDLDEAWNSVRDMYFVNTGLSTGLDILARRVMGAKESDPTMAKRAPHFYKEFFNLLTDMNASPRVANEMLSVIEKTGFPSPPVAINLMEGLGNEDKSGTRNVLDGLGLRVIDYDPVDTVRSEYMRKVKTPTDNAFEQIREYLQFGEELDEGTVEEMYLDAVADEYEGFVDAGKAVRGALASGASRGSLAEGLKQAGVSNEAVSHLLNGRFVPRAFSDQFLDGVEAKLVQKASTFSERTKAKQSINALKRQLKIINSKYRNFTPEE